MTFQLRQNPSNPCQLQQSFGEDIWVTAFDYSLCSSEGLNINDLQSQLDKLIELYDLLSGDVSALYDNLVYDSTSDDDYRDLALCAGISAFVDFVCELVLQEREEEATYARIGAIILGITSAVLVASGIGSPLGLAIATLLVQGYAVAWDGISDIVLSNQGARELVACCMYDSLKGSTISKASFEDSLDACGFTALSPESQIAGAIAPMLDEEDIFTAFLEFVDEKIRPAQLGLVSCICDGTWEFISDFDTEANGFVPYVNNGENASIYAVSSGFSQRSFSRTPTQFWRSCLAEITLSNTVFVTDIDMLFDMTKGYFRTDLFAVYIACYSGGESGSLVAQLYKSASAVSNGTDKTESLAVNATIDFIVVGTRCFLNDASNYSGYTKLKQVTINGAGIIPVEFA